MNQTLLKCLLILWFPLSFFYAGCKKEAGWHDALDSFQLEEGLRIDLVAAEPMVIDPVALAFDEYQRMYVVENRGYPDPAEGGNPTSLGRVARLEDTDGDGTYDLRTEFATGFTYPNGVLPWRGGVFVTCAPDLFYLKDTNGDGVADIRKIILTGFNDTKTSQIRMSSPILGVDGWVYITGGLNGGSITSPEHPDLPSITYNAADGRFHPDTFEFQVTGGKSQFGLSFDSYGHRFGSSNRHPVQHVVLEPWYLQRNKHLPFAQSIQNVSAVEADARVFPISNPTITAEFIPKLIGRSHSGTFTSACGILAFNGTGLTPNHKGNVFICEPAQNLVQRQLLYPEGVSYRSDLPYVDKEFLASTDTWFNPVFLQHGPEGALYLADMHRKVIDHPSYVPEEARATLDFESGKQHGRIYRIVREHFSDANPETPLFSSASTDQLVDALQSTEQWVRSTAQRLLLERSDKSSISSLKQCALKATLGESRLRALWLLFSLDALDLYTIESALSDQEPGVREQAILISESLCKNQPELIEKVAITATDSNARVRFSCALALGSLEGPQVIPALARVAAADGADQWTRAAVLSGIGTRMPEFMEAFREQTAKGSEAFIAVMQDLGHLYGIAAPISDCKTLLQVAIQADAGSWGISTVVGLAEGISRRTEINTNNQKGLLFALLGRSSSKDAQALDKFLTMVSHQVEDQSIPTPVRIKATVLLGYTDFNRAAAVLKKLLDSRNPPELQYAAVAALARHDDLQSAALLIEKSTWSNFTPRMRSVVIGALISKPTLTKVLFDAIDQGLIKATDISSVARERLMKTKDPTIGNRARLLFKELEEGGRMQVYQNLRKNLETPGDVDLGKTVFEKSCASCHSYAGFGGNVGPDLTGVKNQPADALLLHTLVPNYEVYPNYQAISVETSDGRLLSGRLIAETANSLTLRTALGIDESILRANILSLSNTGSSLMPDGLEQGMTNDELMGLIAYLKSGLQFVKP